ENTLPLFSRQRHSFQVAIDILADASETNGSPLIKTYYQDLTTRIAKGRVFVKPVAVETEAKKDVNGDIKENTDNKKDKTKNEDGSPKLIDGDLTFEMNP